MTADDFKGSGWSDALRTASREYGPNVAMLDARPAVALARG